MSALTRRGLANLWLLLALLAPGHALAHEGGITGYAQIVVDGPRVDYALTLSELPPAMAARVVDTASGPDLAPLAEMLAAAVAIRADGAPCRAVGAQAQPVDATRRGARLQVRYSCPQAVGTLAVHDGLFDVVGADLHTLAKVQWPGGEASFSFASERRDAEFAVAPSSAGTAAGTVVNGSFFLLGLQHILEGYDHLLFLAALLVRAQSWRSVLKVITAFTLAHSLTLALAVLGVITPPVRLVEAGIALSIAYVAAGNLRAARRDTARWGTSFVFGLVHGLGFSGILREMALPRESLGWLLLQFNLGVECGQAVAALLALVLLRWLRRQHWHEPALRSASYAILAAGLLLLVHRTVLA